MKNCNLKGPPNSSTKIGPNWEKDEIGKLKVQVGSNGGVARTPPPLVPSYSYIYPPFFGKIEKKNRHKNPTKISLD